MLFWQKCWYFDTTATSIGFWKITINMCKERECSIVWVWHFYQINTNNSNKWTYHTFTWHVLHLLLDTQRFKHIFTILTHSSFPSFQTTSVTVTRYFVTYPRISTGQTAILRTIISKQADSTLCKITFTKRSFHT